MVNNVPNIILTTEDRIPNSGSSNGAQPKYFRDNIWYKKDLCGGEGYSEYLASLVLQASNLASTQYVVYKPCLINGQLGCMSENFLQRGQSYMDLMTLYKYTSGGKDYASYLIDMSPEERLQNVINFMVSISGYDESEIKEYLANIIAFDKFVLNEDRNLKNIGFIYDGTKFLFAPIFDNGRSFFVGQSYYNDRLSMQENVKKVYAKPFSSSFEKQYEMLSSYVTLQINAQKLRELISSEPDSLFKQLLEHQICFEDICIDNNYPSKHENTEIEKESVEDEHDYEL